MNKYHLSPHFYVASVVLVTLGAIALFSQLGHHDRWYFLPLFGIGLVWAAENFRRQLSGQAGSFHIDWKSGFRSLLKRAIARYAIWAIVFGLAVAFYQSHPYYSKHAKNSEFIVAWYQIFLIGGLPYFLVTLRFKASRTEDYYDPAVRMIMMLRHVVFAAMNIRRRTHLAAIFRKPYNRKVILNLVMRGYFIPVMIVQVASGYENLVHGVGNLSNLLSLLTWLTAFLWLIDASSAGTGYCLETRWLENRSRSVDLTASGWLICLCCYVPLNDVTGTLFPFGPSVANDSSHQLIFSGEGVLLTIKIVELIVLGALVYSDLSLGSSGVNITLKKLQNRGPYGIVRHPATVCKLSLWWIESVFYMNFWSWEFLFGQIMWSVIYVLRALSEERHLRQFPEYREYQEAVPYRFVPRVF